MVAAGHLWAACSTCSTSSQSEALAVLQGPACYSLSPVAGALEALTLPHSSPTPAPQHLQQLLSEMAASASHCRQVSVLP